MSNLKQRYVFLIVILFGFFTNFTYAQEGFRGTIESIPPDIATKMQGHSWHDACPLPLKSMSYLTVNYWGFDHKPHQGHFIILNILAGETLQIFQELYQIKFPIEKMVLPSVYSSKQNDWLAIDWKSSEDDDTYGFLCRFDDQSPGKFSPHSYGVAMDINPVYNPAVVANNKIEPEKGRKYFDRNLQHEGMINEKVVAIFAKHGWKWGGYWGKDKLDYMHFEKDMDEHYMCRALIPDPKKL